ncbi:CDP-alcohol phosphatidyltransferase family protein [soil metagenome]
MANDTWSHAAARVMVRPLIGTPVKPNHITTLRLITGAAACLLLAPGTFNLNLWAGGLWIVSAFLDRADGELARIGNMQSRKGHLYDYYTDVLLNSAFFLGAGFGVAHSWLGAWAIPLGVVACVAMFLCSWLSEVFEDLSGPGVRTWEGAWGFQPDDALYLLGPAAWTGALLLAPIVLLSAICTSVMAVVIWVRLERLRRKVKAAAAA